MGARVWAAVLAAFCLLSGCAAPETSTALEASSGWETATVSPADGNPYAGTGETSTGWLYAVYEAYRGAETEKYSETREFTYLCYDLEFRRSDPPGNARGYSNHIYLPQCEGEDTFAHGLSRHYRERYDALLAEEQAYLKRCPLFGPGEPGTDFLGRGLVMRDEYLWNGFYQVILDRECSGWRARHEPVVELFDAGTGGFIPAEDVFAGAAEVWLPAFSQQLQERGVLPAREDGESRRLEEAERDGLRRYTEYVLGQGVTGDFSNLMLTPGGLGIAFAAGSIAANCAGPVIVVLPYGEAAGLLAPGFGPRLLPDSGAPEISGS